MLLEKLSPFGYLQPKGRILAGNTDLVNLRVLGENLLSFLFSEIENVVRPGVAEAHIKDIIDVRRVKRGHKIKCGV